MHFSIALMSSSYSTVYWFSCFKINSDLTFSLQISALENFTRIPSQSLMLCPAANKIQVYFYRITWKVVICGICLSTHFYMYDSRNNNHNILLVLQAFKKCGLPFCALNITNSPVIFKAQKKQTTFSKYQN